mmetsp:Transcript_31784/g.55295  ORF Transcript_31784/g.55295 Transcript_31784/m.55295 type:complete len:254 (+) Transcript_31784:380-1141(+)
MSCENRSDHVHQLQYVVDFVKDDTVHSVCIFCLSKKRFFHFVEKLEEKLDSPTLEQIIDVIHVHGSLCAEEKCILIRIFCQKYNLPEFTPCILVATVAANVGIDNHCVLYILMLRWLWYLCTFFQQSGRAGRLEGQFTISILIGDVTLFVGTMFLIYSTNKTAELDDTDKLDDFNSVITTPTRKQKPELHTSTTSCALTTTQQRNLEQRQRDEFMDLLCYHVLDQGCQLIRGRLFMSNGELDRDRKCAYPIEY